MHIKCCSFLYKFIEYIKLILIYCLYGDHLNPLKYLRTGRGAKAALKLHEYLSLTTLVALSEKQSALAGLKF